MVAWVMRATGSDGAKTHGPAAHRKNK